MLAPFTPWNCLVILVWNALLAGGILIGSLFVSIIGTFQRQVSSIALLFNLQCQNPLLTPNLLNFIAFVTRKYDTLIHLLSYGWGGATLGPSATVVVSRLMEREAVSLPPPFLWLQGDIGVGEPHYLLAMYVSAEKQTFDHDWYRGRAHQKNQYVVNFQTTENKLVAVHSSSGEDA